eukprot:gene17582-19334_t
MKKSSLKQNMQAKIYQLIEDKGDHVRRNVLKKSRKKKRLCMCTFGGLENSVWLSE